MERIVVTASTPMELSLLVEQTHALPTAEMGHLPAYRATVAGREVLLAVTGIGKVNASCATTVVMERCRPGMIINTGCAGAFAGSGLAIGDLAFASSESFADEGVEMPQGWGPLETIGIPVWERDGERFFNSIPVGAELAAQALDFARDRGDRALLGPFLTVSTCSGTASRGARLLRRFPGICENMEGAAVAQVALIYGVDFLEVRGISNMVEDRDLSRWELRRAVEKVQSFLAGYLPQTQSLASNSFRDPSSPCPSP